MKRVPVHSTSIAEIGYDERTRTLEIQFRHGGVYQYFEIPASVHRELLAAPSRGRYVAERIKGVYRFAQL